MLTIERVENGFLVVVVVEADGDHSAMVGAKRVFETADNLADYVSEWGKSHERKEDLRQHV